MKKMCSLSDKENFELSNCVLLLLFLQKIEKIIMQSFVLVSLTFLFRSLMSNIMLLFVDPLELCREIVSTQLAKKMGLTFLEKVTVLMREILPTNCEKVKRCSGKLE